MRLLGIDIGTTAVKAAIFDIDGRVVCNWQRNYPTMRSRGGIVEQNPQDWLDGIFDAIAALSGRCDLGTIGAVGICSQVNTHVFVDSDGTPLAAAIVWQDTRAADEARELDATLTAAERQEWWGAPFAIDASHVLARMRWLEKHQPALWAKVRYALSPKDYCIFRLTGNLTADAIASVGLVDSSLRYIDALAARVPGAHERFPPLQAYDQIIGRMSLGRDGASVPVVNGTMDAWASLFGSGAFAPGKGMYMSGTSEILALVGSRSIGAPGVITFPKVDGLIVNAGPTQSGGDSVRWWAQATGKSIDDIFALAATASRDDAPMLFLPHLEGERAPLWDSSLRAAFVGASARSGAAELALAVLEGVALSAHLLLQSLRVASGVRPDALIYGGGGSRSDLWSQIRADCLGIPLRRLSVPDAGCLGAAIIGAVGIGAFQRIADASDAMARIDRVFEPDAQFENRYRCMSLEYSETIKVLKSVRGSKSEPMCSVEINA